MEFALIINLLASGIRTGTCILFATVGEIFAERAGVLNLGLEGMMVFGAMTAFGVSSYTGSAWLGLLAAALVGGLLALLHAYVTITLRADQVVSGLALTFVGTGLASVLGSPLVDIAQAPRLPNWPIPLLVDIPILGPLFFNHNAIVYLGFVLIPLSWFYIYRTRPGLELRAIGEYPAAADVQGVNVFVLRYLYVFIGGVGAGIGGAALTLAISPRWIEGITGGLGWIAVGLVIFAQWDPVRAAIGSYLFGAIRRLPLDLQNVGIFLRNPALGYFTNMLPYLFTVIVLIIGSRAAMRRRVGAPAALGQPYVREERGA
jgi:general nucleoside transport system permease protein